jgi:ATP-dependent DNA ligase
VVGEARLRRVLGEFAAYYNESRTHRALNQDAVKMAMAKRRDLPYQSGRSKSWVKVRNPARPAMQRYE